METILYRMSASGNAFFIALELDAEIGPALARRLTGRCDGLILGSSNPPSMRMFNPDGSEAMCGNGLRCLARCLADRGAFRSGGFVATLDGAKCISLRGDFVEAEMGRARPLSGFGAGCSEAVSLELGGETFVGYGVFVGNPHWVIPSDETLQARVAELGPQFERHPRFPEGVNSEFAVARGGEISVRVWERGVGETLSCGTGALAVATAGPDPIAPGRTKRIRYPGGLLRVRADDSGLLHLGGRVRREGTFRWNERDGLVPLQGETKHDPAG